MKTKHLIVATPQGFAGDLLRESQYVFNYGNTDPACEDRTLALKLNKSKNYPTRETLIAFGKQHCHIRSPEKSIERIGDAMHDTLAAHGSRVESGFLDRMSREWQEGLASISPPRKHVI